MPEYLAPDVYVEEVDSGSKPIEGVSTSTAAMLGVAERGPANVPILVTSHGEYTRWFGGRLDPALFGDHCFLPHAAEGFFTNGGKRLYVTRVEAPAALHAFFDLHDRGTATSGLTRLLRPAAELSAGVYVLNTNSVFPNSGTLANGDRIRVGSGSDAEYRIATNVAGAAFHVPVTLPLARAHATGATIHDITIVAAPAPNAFSLAADTAIGANDVILNTPPANVAIDDLLEIGTGGLREFRFILAIAPDALGCRVTLDSPLALEHAATTAVNKRQASPGGPAEIDNSTLDGAAPAATAVAFAAVAGPNFDVRDELVVFERANTSALQARREVRRIGRLAVIRTTGAFDAYPTGSVVAGVTLTAAATPARLLTARAAATATAIALNDRTVLTVGQVLRIGAGPAFELATILALPSTSAIAPDAGTVVLSHSLRAPFAIGTVVQPMNAAALRTDRPATSILLDARRGDEVLAISDGGDPGVPDQYSVGDIVRITTASGDIYFDTLTATAVDTLARPITLGTATERPHPVGSWFAERGRLLSVQALDTGGWGNRLRLSVEDEAPGLVARTPIITAIAANRLRLGSLSGVEAGTLLEVVDAATGAQLEAAVMVQTVDRATGEITLDATAPLSAAQFATVIGAPPSSFVVRSREFRISVRLLRQPDPVNPIRNGTVLDREVFRFLSMDPRHSRYVQTVIGDLAGPPRLSDRRPDGESWYVRVSDLASPPPAVVRFGPEALVDVLPDGRIEPARHPLAGGDDSILTLSDATYIGVDNVNPEARTGLFSLANVDEISIVASPGRTSAQLQGALIAHCENLRYRFAVLDGRRPPNDAIDDVRAQRQQFDTKYAGLYHPWLLVPQPFPASAATPPEFAIPPSGHVVGVFARTDVERGVHKAPANEVVRGIVGLQRVLNKEQHDLLNPYPVNINVIRDFRRDNRGIRVYGGRCITSDSDWKYVNVRRLLIFIEKSINQGLQWVVFEPNAEPLWARVRRSISNFLTLTWRNGALEGTTPEEAYFVKCDRTTMTQTDIDSGRLICLVGVAPVKPAEFVIVRIGLWTAHAEE